MAAMLSDLAPIERITAVFFARLLNSKANDDEGTAGDRKGGYPPAEEPTRLEDLPSDVLNDTRLLSLDEADATELVRLALTANEPRRHQLGRPRRGPPAGPEGRAEHP